MDTDERFKHLAADPRFKTLRKKQRKVEVDERFQSMFTDERFILRSGKDKRGRKNVKPPRNDLTKYYTIDKKESKSVTKGDQEQSDDELQPENAAVIEVEKVEKIPEIQEDEEETEEDSLEVDEDEEEIEEQDVASDADDEEESQSEVSSSSDESESEVDDDNQDLHPIQYDWQPLDHDAVKSDTTSRRLAIQHLDWTHLDVNDIYTLVNSIRPPLSVRIYISEYGKERLAKEEVDGPQELADLGQVDEEEEEYNLLKSRMDALERKGSKEATHKANEYEDADEVLDMKNEEIRERIRRYQLSRMKYYYAIAEFDSAESAEAVYKELDGIEYEGSSLELDLRFVPDDMVFDASDMQAECTKVPDLATYKAPQFINSALQQTTVKFTWDETDVKRQEKLQRAYTKEELEKDDLDAYLASDSEDEEETPFDCATDRETTNRADKYRQLLKSLDEETEKKKKIDVDVVWGDYEGDEKRTAAATVTVGKQAKGATKSNAVINEEDDEYDQDDGLYEGASKRRSTSKREKTTKSKKKNRRANGSDDECNNDDADADAHLDLLVMDARKQEEFEFNPDDDRFGAVYESGLYNIDPSHPNFKRTKAFDQIAEKKRQKRRKTSR